MTGSPISAAVRRTSRRLSTSPANASSPTRSSTPHFAARRASARPAQGQARRPGRGAGAEHDRYAGGAVRLRPHRRGVPAAEHPAHGARAALHRRRRRTRADDPRCRACRGRAVSGQTMQRRLGAVARSWRFLRGRDRGCTAARPSRIVTLDDISTIMYTSGTTGQPKGAIITHGMTFWNCVNLGGPAYISPSTVLLDRAAAVPYRRTQLLHQPGAACRRHRPDHARVRSRRWRCS